eukprot:TRINITY_DN12129_c0_g1_i1.p3 TRINITY_DN12129_c0_g1~~TRINITY_DN12129_c0_g1_i1.p3  ORF type:complete len:145 (-),score=7.30 TRINITY_DN12129_c0_g1_i1:46-480(-)
MENYLQNQFKFFNEYVVFYNLFVRKICSKNISFDFGRFFLYRSPDKFFIQLIRIFLGVQFLTTHHKCFFCWKICGQNETNLSVYIYFYLVLESVQSGIIFMVRTGSSFLSCFIYITFMGTTNELMVVLHMQVVCVQLLFTKALY